MKILSINSLKYVKQKIDTLLDKITQREIINSSVVKTTGSVYLNRRSGDTSNRIFLFRIVNNLESISETDVLSAAQGKMINEKIESEIEKLNQRVTDLENRITK